MLNTISVFLYFSSLLNHSGCDLFWRVLCALEKKSVVCCFWSECSMYNTHTSNEYLGLISLRLDLLAVPGTLKSLLQHHSSKASILRRSAFFMIQLSHLYMTTERTTALTVRTFVITFFLKEKKNYHMSQQFYL